MTLLTTALAAGSEVNPADEQRLMDNLRTRLPGALDGVIQMEAFNAYHQFFDESSSWHDTGFVTVSPGVDAYQIFPSRGRILRLVEVTDRVSDIRLGATMARPGTIVLNQVPSQTQDLQVETILTVNPRTPTDTGLPDVPALFYHQYFDAAFNGIMAQMLSQPAKPYSNLNLAKLHMVLFKQAIAQARHETTHGNIQRGQAWRFPQTGVGRRQVR